MKKLRLRLDAFEVRPQDVAATGTLLAQEVTPVRSTRRGGTCDSG